MGGGGSTPTPPPVTPPPPPARDIDIEYVTPTMVQELARRQKQGAFVTKGQSLGQEGQVLGAEKTELANIQTASGIGYDPALSNLTDVFAQLQTPEEYFSTIRASDIMATPHERITAFKGFSQDDLADFYRRGLEGERTSSKEFHEGGGLTDMSFSTIRSLYQSYQLENIGLMSKSEFKNKYEYNPRLAENNPNQKKYISSDGKEMNVFAGRQWYDKNMSLEDAYNQYYEDTLKRNEQFRAQQRQGMII